MSPITQGRGTIPDGGWAAAVETAGVQVPVERPGRATPVAGEVSGSVEMEGAAVETAAVAGAERGAV